MVKHSVQLIHRTGHSGSLKCSLCKNHNAGRRLHSRRGLRRAGQVIFVVACCCLLKHVANVSDVNRTGLSRTARMSDISEFLFPSWAIPNVTIIKHYQIQPKPQTEQPKAPLAHSHSHASLSLWQRILRIYSWPKSLGSHRVSVAEATTGRTLFISILISTFRSILQ